MLKSKYSIPNKGFLPVVIILALSFVSVLSVAVFLAFKEEDSPVADNSVATEQSTNAFQAANSGSEAVLGMIYKEDDLADLKVLAEATNSECSEGVISGFTSVGSYRVSLFNHSGEQIKNCTDSTWRSQVTQLKSEGISGDTSRAINVAVAAEPTPGIVGGCAIANSANSGTTQIRSSWGAGCKAPSTKFSGIAHCSSKFRKSERLSVAESRAKGIQTVIDYVDGERPSVAAPGYSCGEISISSGNTAYCVCVKN